MKRRFAALTLAVGMLLSQAAGSISAFAENGQNAYGHSVVYEPITQLYTAGEPIRFFDSGLTAWNDIENDKITQNEAGAVKWLTENDYLLNRFGTKYSAKEYTPGCFNAKGEWLTQLKGPTNVRKWYANVRFDRLSEQKQRENGNISNLYDKGDLQYFFSWKVKTVQTKWGLFDQSNDTGSTRALGETTHSRGGGWKKYNTLFDGPNLNNFSAWKPAQKLQYISFVAESDKDAQVDSYLSGAMLVGRDIHGPKIASVTVTADADGKEEIANGAITLDAIEKLTDRTVYFRVQWDEPVAFSDKMKPSDLAKLSLKVETIGIDGTSGMTAEAPFLRFAPSKNDAKPVMIFEYKIADPYTDATDVTQERGYFYRFSNVTVSKNRNEALWEHICDISGNRFAADENGQQPPQTVITPVSGSPYVDLLPFGIENIRMTKDSDDSNAFIRAGGLLGITLELNKESAEEVKTADLPSVTLNVKDPEGSYVTIRPSDEDIAKQIQTDGKWVPSGYFYKGTERLKPVMLAFDRKSITYYVQLYPGCTLDDDAKYGNSIQVIAVSSGNMQDASGYSFMGYTFHASRLSPNAEDFPKGASSKIQQYAVSPDKQYKLDFAAPILNLSAGDPDEGIMMLKAAVTDKSLTGCDVTFTVKLSGTAAGEGIAYQAAAGESYKDNEWKKSERGTMTVSFGAPIIASDGGGTAYGFIQLPKDCEADTITVSAVAVDEAQNSANATKEFSSPDWRGYDTLAPRIELSVRQEIIHVSLSDSDDAVEYSYGFSAGDAAVPAAYTTVQGKSGTIAAPKDLPQDTNEVFTRVLWITAKDSHGNTSTEPVKLSVDYDRTFTDIQIDSVDTSKQYGPGQYPGFGFKVTKATSYWWMWAEKPANVSDTAAYIAKHCLRDMKTCAETYGHVSSASETATDFNNLYSELSDYASVAVIDGATETYEKEAVSPNQTSRPIMLIIAAEKEDGTTLVKTVEFDTFYGAPKASVQQTRFSTSNNSGQRIDYTVGSKTTPLFRATDTKINSDTEEGSDTQTISYPLNTPALNGFAQAEFKLVGDPVTGLDRVDIANSFVTLEKVVYEGTDVSGNVIDRSRISTWGFLQIGLGKDSADAVIDIDPKNLETTYYEVDENGNRNAVRYEFVCHMNYQGGFGETEAPITYFAFCNEPNGFLFDASYRTDGWGRYESFSGYGQNNVEVVFDQNENDVTPNVPLYTINAGFPQGQGALYIRFSASGFEWGSDCDNAYHSAPYQKMVMRIGTSPDPDKLDTVLPFAPDYYGAVSDYYDVGQYLFGSEGELREVKLYYRFEFTDSRDVSPMYVLKLRHDQTDPVVELAVSETEQMTNEVLVWVSGMYDVQKAPDGTIVTDTPESELSLWIEAWRKVTENDDISGLGDDDLQFSASAGGVTYVRVQPDEDGVYHFISNGYFAAHASDNAGNRNESLVINGVLTELEGSDFKAFYINNVSNEPPKLLAEPTFTADNANGKFSLEATADKTVKNVYLKFDAAYTEQLAASTTESALHDVQDIQYDLASAPGTMHGSFDGETGAIGAEIYVKPQAQLTSAALIIEDSTGNQTEYPYSFNTPIDGRNARITNAPNESGYPTYNYGEALTFSVPVKMDGTDGTYALSHRNPAVYSDGTTQITYTDLFGEQKTETIYVNIYGEAFAHTLTFTQDGQTITPDTKVSSDVTVAIDTSQTEGLSVTNGKTDFIFTENGMLTYSLTNAQLKQTKTFSVPITNIDKTPPEAIVSVRMDSERDAATGVLSIYSVTYSVEGFSEDGVTLLPNDNNVTPTSVTFDIGSDKKAYTFRFRDEAGNEGSYTADVSDLSFAEKKDTVITDYRLTYTVPDANGFRTLATCTKASESVSLGLVNKAVSVNIEALNQSGEVVSANVSQNGALPSGAVLYAKEKLVMFTTESDEDRTVELTLSGAQNSSVSAKIVLPKNTIDMTAPTGTVRYEADGNKVRAYLETNDTDLAKNGISVIGTKQDGTALTLETDENGNYYTELDQNGTGRFVMMDHAGNIGNVAIAVFTIDTDEPEVKSEGWQGIMEAGTEAEIATLLSTPTNSSIKLFITFNEQLSRTDIKAFENDPDTKELTPTEAYATAITSGRTLTVEFKKNCRVQLVAYDLRGNACTLLRPADGPITAIDRDAPKLLGGAPTRSVTADNKVELTYEFDEAVMLLSTRQDEYKDGYIKKHCVTFSENGAKILNFADRAGNVFSDYPVITEIDELAPSIAMSVQYEGSGKELSPIDGYVAGNMYTNKNVRILLRVTDEHNEKVTVSAKTKSGKSIPVSDSVIRVTDPEDSSKQKTYNYSFVVTENGSYIVTATDKWGHANTVETSVSVIDKTGPTIRFAANAVVVKAGTKADEVTRLILQNTTAVDSQSGANNPMGDRDVTASEPVTLAVALNGAALDKEGQYTVKVTAKDRLENETEKNFTVIVLKDVYTFNVNGSIVYANDVLTTSKGVVKIFDANETAKYYYAQGYKTAAQMKYAKGFHANVGFDAQKNGYYTVLAQEEGRKMYLFYLYVN